MSKVRTRFAPSPTGYMHIGNLRTALYEYLIAKSADGDFILRIEDTDQERFVEGAMDVIYDTLDKTGIKFDEGPGVGGEYGPYIQSQRKPIYKKYAEELVHKGHAYYCFCTKERLDSLKSDENSLGTGFNYDRHCRNLPQSEIDEKLASGIPYVIRQKAPLEGTTTFSDAVYGDITVENKTLDDQVLLKSDGLPTYNFANVVDDHLMKISHVVRGNEYLSSTPKYNLLYEAFGWDIPVYVHCAPIMKDESHKLSKRNGDASFKDLTDKGFLPEAILNYIALLGWAPSTNEEFYSLKDLEKAFDIKGISKSPAIFDPEKLKWMNSEYIRRMDPEAFYKLILPYIETALGEGQFSEAATRKIASLIQPRLELLNDAIDKISFFANLPEYSIDLYTHKKMKTDPAISLESLKIVREAVLAKPELKDSWTSPVLYEFFCALAQEKGLKNSQILWPVRTALSGRDVSPGGATDLAEILGYEESMTRIINGIEKLS